MKIYAGLARLFPNSFPAKVFLIAFIGTHMPLIATVYFLLAERGGIMANLEICLVMLAATLIGTAATLYGLRAILQPLFHIRDAMEAFETRREKLELPAEFHDEIGKIMAMTNRLIGDVDLDLRRKKAAANADPLTGLLNRRGFEQTVPSHAGGAIIYVDLDHFKAVNDRHGHDIGDKVLTDAARALMGAIRSGDVLSRFGGEEFVIFLPGADMPAAKAVAERGRLALEAKVQIAGEAVTGSFGVAHTAAGGELAVTLKQADAAVYVAKSEGRNRVVSALDAAVDAGAE
ncbi:MAG: GGDEF domain-containing protein [Pseudomonadota bacterium]